MKNHLIPNLLGVLLCINSIQAQDLKAIVKEAGDKQYFFGVRNLDGGIVSGEFYNNIISYFDKETILTYTSKIFFSVEGENLNVAALYPYVFPPAYQKLVADGTVDDKFLKKRRKRYTSINYNDEGNGKVSMYFVMPFRDNKYKLITDMQTAAQDLSELYAGFLGWGNVIAKDGVKEFSGAPLSGMENIWVPYYLTHAKLSEYEKDPGNAKGFWSYTYTGFGTDVDLYNYEDRFEMYVTVPKPAGKSFDSCRPEIENFIKKNKLRATQVTPAQLSSNGRVGVKITYQYDQGLKGKDLMDDYDARYNYCKKLGKIF